jgi:hypothetical protein
MYASLSVFAHRSALMHDVAMHAAAAGAEYASLSVFAHTSALMHNAAMHVAASSAATAAALELI